MDVIRGFIKVYKVYTHVYTTFCVVVLNDVSESENMDSSMFLS